MTELTLPPKINGEKPQQLSKSRQITLIGANGSGKTRFMNNMIKNCTDKAFVLSALSAFYPDQRASKLPGSISDLFNTKINESVLPSQQALSELDKVLYILFNDEFKYLLSVKTEMLINDKETKLKPTKLDKLINLWQHIFPGNRILREAGRIMFTTGSGTNRISTDYLSSGEKVALYYIAAVQYAMPDAIIFIESPTLFLHPSILGAFWNGIESLRPDCTFVYNTYDVGFINSRIENLCVWVKSYDVHKEAWDYQIFDSEHPSDEMFVDLIGSRRPILFIEGDATHSIDSKLYPLVFSDCMVRPLGSCNKVIESTRSFNDLKTIHDLESFGIVDRDRRTDAEVSYLNDKNILVPNVAEIENIFLLEGVVRTMAVMRGKNPDYVFNKVRQAIIHMFITRFDEQALLHVRHAVKHEVECKIDGRFSSIGELEHHLRSLNSLIQPRETYDKLRREFKQMIDTDNYAGILKVFNYKPMLPNSHIAELLGYPNKDRYIAGVLGTLKRNDKIAKQIRATIKHCFGMKLDQQL